MADWKNALIERLQVSELDPACEAEIIDELAQHLEERYQDLLASGIMDEDARRIVLEELSDSDLLVRELQRVEPAMKHEPFVPGAAGGKNILADLWQDLRYGLRQLRRNPGFTAVAVITLALGIAANTTIFSLVSGWLLRKPPVRDPDRVLTISSKNIVRGDDLESVSALDFQAWRAQGHAFANTAAVEGDDLVTLTGSGEPQPLLRDQVTPNYFQVLGWRPAIGRDFLPSEGQPGRNRVAILSHELWKQRYGGNARVIGREIEINEEPYTVIGIMPPGTDMTIFMPRLWTPLAFTAHDLTPAARANRNLTVFARLKPDVSIEQAQAEMASIASRLAQAHPKTDKDWRAIVLTLQEFIIRSFNVSHGLMLLMTTVCFVLLIACANIAGLLVARGAARAHEMAIRSAVGANRLRLVRQMLAESLLLGLAGGAAGLLMSIWGIHVLRAGLTFNFVIREMASTLGLDGRTLLFTGAISLITAILFGLVPAARASKTNLVGALKEGVRTDSGGQGRSKMRNGLVAGEIALALMLLTGAGLMMRELVHELTQNPGFNPGHLMIAEINLKGRNYRSPAQQMEFFERVTERCDGLAGVRSASATSALPLTGGSGHVSFSVEGQPPLPPSKRPLTEHFVVGPAYFRTMQISLLRGRFFGQADNTRSPIVVVANEEFVRRFFPKGNAIGHRIKLDIEHPAWAEIVGVVENVIDYGGQLSPDAQIYQSYLQTPVTDMWLVMRSHLSPSAAARMLRRTVWSLDKNLAIGNVEGGVLTMKDVANENLGGDKWMVLLLGVFAGLALILAAVGIYGVIAYSVSRRTHEIGIRMALGAQKGDVLRLVLRQGGLLTLIGCGIGLALGLPLPKLFGAIFNGFGPQGPWIPISVGLVVGAVSLLATYIPARRAASVDPLTALRYE
jgi:predicted permease